MHKYINKHLSILTLILLLPVVSAQAAGGEKTAFHFNAILIGLVTLVLLLLFAILVLGNTLRQLGFAYRDKLRKDRATGNTTKVLLLLVATGSAFAAHAQDAATASQAPAYISGIPAFDFYVLMAIIILELLVLFSLAFLIRLVIKMISNEPEPEVVPKKEVKVNFWDKFNKVVPIEKEQDILLDHDYDGIRELDNSLPPWWKYGFYLTIVVAVIYLWYYHVGGNGPSSHEEFVAEVQAGEEAKAAYLAKAANNVDENTVVMLDASGIAAGQAIFQSVCAACHANDGGGGVGPNLTDDYWLHGGSIKDIFKSIKYGWPDKGMKSWKDDFSPTQVAQLASYVKSLKGASTAAPKEKQGELYIEGDNTTPADSTATEVHNAETAMK